MLTSVLYVFVFFIPCYRRCPLHTIKFLLQNYTLDGTVVVPKLFTLPPGMDYMTSYKAWLDVQNGDSDVETVFVDEPVFIRNGRDLSTLAFRDEFYRY